MNTCILIQTKYRKNFLSLLTLFIATSFLLTNEGFGQTAPNAEFPTITGTGLTGTGTFDCDAMPDFDITITGDVDPNGDTGIPGLDQIVDNVGGGFETIYGQADMEDNIEVEVAGFFGPAGSPISNTVVTTLDFDGPTPPGQFSFLIADVEQDQVQICALDENFNPVSPAVIDSWFVTSFDADNSDGTTIPPTWDPITSTLVGQEGNGVRQTIYQPALPDNEAGAGFFTVTTSITQLTFKSQALGVAPDDPSQHFILAATCQVFDLALIKQVVTPGPYAAGDDVTFDIEVCNQGNVDAFNIDVTDNIPSGMTLSTSDANGWASAGAGAVTTTIPTIAAGMCETVQIDLTIDPSFMGTSLINNAEISAADDDMDSTNTPPTDVDSTPGDNSQPNDLADDNDLLETDGGDDEDPEEIMIEQTYDLALIKTEASTGPYSPGDDVTFDITVCNQGTLDAAGIEVTDNIPSGLLLSAADANGWMGPNTGPVTLGVSPLVVGACTTVQIVLTVDPTFTGTSIINNAEISADDGDDVDSTTGDNSQPNDLADDNDLTETDGGDDEDPEEIVINPNVYDLALIKEEVSAGPYGPGDDITFTISIFNQGNVDAGFITVSDVIPAGLSLSTADTNGWAGGPTGTVTNVISGPLAGGAPTTVDIVLTVDANAPTGFLVNNAEITTDNGDDVDSTPGDSSQPDDFADDNDVTETDGGDDEDPEQVEICNCDPTADAGTMVFPPDSEGCIDDMGSTVTLITTPTGDAVIPPGYVLTFVLTVNNTFDIVDCSDSPNVVVDEPGWFTVHPVVYDPNTFDPCSLIGSTIFDMEALFASDPCVCGDVDTTGVEQGAYFCCLDMLRVDMDPMPPLLHDAAIGLFSSGTVDMPNSTTRLSGGEFVEMQAGFNTVLGSNFEAFIGPCAETGN